MKTQLLATSLLLASTFATACSSLARPFTGPDADFSGAGGAITPDDDLPCADSCVPKGLRIALDSTLMDDDFRAQLAEKMRAAAGGRYVSMQGQTNEPQFELVVTEMTNNSKFDPSEVGAVVGGIGGAVGGAAADRWRGRGAVIGGVGGAAVGWAMFSKQQDTWAFEIKFKQRTSAAGKGRIEQKQDNSTNSGGGQVGNTGLAAGGSSSIEQTKRVSFDVTSNTAVQTRYVAVAVEGGAFSSEAGRKEAAKKALLDRLPGFLMGGNVVNF